MKVAFIIVLYKTPKEEVDRLKKEIKDIGFGDYKVYFIDNTKVNRGYAAGVNKGIKKAIIDNYGLLIVGNPDISLKGIKATDLLAVANHFDICGFAFKQQGKIYYGGCIDKLRLSGSLTSFKPKNRFVNVEWVSGSLLCIKKEVIEMVGLFDERLFMYYEDVDYCLRATKAGFKVGIDSDVAYEHFEKSDSNPNRFRLLANAKIRFFRKYGNIWQKMYELMRLPKTIVENSFLVNFFSLNVSSFVGKFLNFILFLFLIRYLTLQDYGIYTLVWAQVSLFSPIVDLGTTSYGLIHLPIERKQKFVSLFNLRFGVSIIIFFATILTSFFIFKNNQRVISYTVLISFVIFSNMFSGSYLIKNAVQRKLYNSSIVSLGFNSILVFFLILSLIIFRSLSVVFIIIFLFYNLYSLLNHFLVRKGFAKFYFKLEFDKWIKLIKKSYVFVLISLFAGLYFKIDVFLLQKIKGEQAVGIYSAGYKFFEALLFIATSYNISRTPIFAKMAKNSSTLLVKTVKKDIILLGIVGFLIASSTYFLAPFLLPLFLKKDYYASIEVVRLVMLALPFILMSSVFLNALYVLKRTKLVIAIFVFQVIMNFVLNIIFIPKYSFIASSYITVLSEVVNVSILLIIFLLHQKKYYENIA